MPESIKNSRCLVRNLNCFRREGGPHFPFKASCFNMGLTVPTPGTDRNVKVLNPIYVFNENLSELEYFYLGREALTRD